MNSSNIDYSPLLDDIRFKIDALDSRLMAYQNAINLQNELLGYISGFLLFMVIVVIMVYGYKFFKLFF